MKIDQTRVDPLLQQEQVQRRSQSDGASGFDEILASESAAAQATQGTAVLPPPGAMAGIDPRFAAQQLDNVAAIGIAGTEEALESLGGLLDELDSYMADLNGTSQGGLREASAKLGSIEQRLAAMKGDPSVTGDDGLSAMVSEIEVLAATERIKFNRGDYI